MKIRELKLPAAELAGYRATGIMPSISQPRWAGFPLRYNELQGISPKKKLSVSVRVGLWRIKKTDSLTSILERALNIGEFISYNRSWGFVRSLEDIKHKIDTLVKDWNTNFQGKCNLANLDLISI